MNEHVERRTFSRQTTGRTAAAEHSARLYSLPNGLYRLAMEGRFPPGWTGALSLGLAHLNITIVSGYAWKGSWGRWSAEIVLRPLRSDLALHGIDFVRMARDEAGAVVSAPVVIDDYALSVAAQGQLVLSIRGKDRVGFLGGLLTLFASLWLFPEEMQIATDGAVAADVFWLRSTGGLPPSPRARAALENLLTRRLRHAAPNCV